jgi:hypothetical protein
MNAETTTASAAPSVADLAPNLGADDEVHELPPLPPPGMAGDIPTQLAALQQQVAALLALMPGVVQIAGAAAASIPKIGDEALQAAAAAQPLPQAPVNERRVKIILEDNDAIPPGGQFASVDGRPFLLQSGMEMDAPISLLDVLDHAITSIPVCDENRNVIGYRDRLRFPYRVVRTSDE